MSKQIILLIILSAALLLCIGYIIYSLTKTEALKQTAVLENILSRKSVRHFIKDKEISQEQIDKILRAGMAAPSARNMQPWEFIVITDKSVLQSIANKIPSGKMLTDASLGIVVAGKTDVQNEFWDQDTSAATENMLLAIEAMKLGAVWIGIYPKQERMSVIVEEISLPENVIPLNVIAIGYPTGEDLPKDKWKSEKIHYNKY
ncbi:MAG: nitroreductase family protein [Candidatus Gastranaerophilales bacterium]|nr:nitroreductase family protein [Candidatus Gastranaerophilales bacterium]